MKEKISIWKNYLIILFIHFIYIQTEAQQIQVKFDHLTSVQGLSINTVNDIIKDKYGFLWIGTSEGLDRYDGYSFKIFDNDPTNRQSLAGSRISALLRDNKGNIWVGTRHGLSMYDYRTEEFINYFHNEHDKNSLSFDAVNCLFQDKSGIIWIGTMGGGVTTFNPANKKFTRYLHEPGNPLSLGHNNVFSIMQDRFGSVWIGTAAHGIERFNPATGTFIKLILKGEKRGAVNYYGKNLYEDKDGNMWIGTKGDGAYFWNRLNNNVIHYTKGNSNTALNNNIIMDFCDPGDGTIWMATDGGGINRLNKATGRFDYMMHDSRSTTSISSNSTRVLYVDDRKNIYVGTWDGGINIANPDKNIFSYYTENITGANGLSYKSINCFAEDRDGKVWIGTDGGGLDCFDPQNGSFENYKHIPGEKQSIGGNKIKTIYYDSKGNIWLGTFGDGLTVFSPKQKRFKHYRYSPTDSNRISSNNIWSILEVSTGKFFIGTSSGLDILDPVTEKIDRFVFPQIPKSFFNVDAVLALKEDSKKNVWIGTGLGGLCCYNLITKEFKRFSHKNGDPSTITSDEVRSICISKEDNLWIGSRGGGLIYFDTKAQTFKAYFKKDGLVSNVIQHITYDSLGDLWLSTSQGLCRYRIQEDKFYTYTSGDGLVTDEFNHGILTSSGDLYFGGYNGFVTFNPKSIKNNKFNPPVLITGIKIFNRDVKPGDLNSSVSKPVIETDQIVTSYKDKMLTIEFVALDFTNPQKNQYKYMLENFDNDWVATDASRRFATYTSLPAGNYVFKVIASNNDGVWNETGVSLKIVVLPPWWKTWWFKTFIIIAIILSGSLFYYRRTRKLHMQKQQLELMVRERTLELEEANAMLEENKDEINAQNEELKTQRDSLEKTNLILTEQKLQIEEQNKELDLHHNKLELLVEERTRELTKALYKAEESDRLKTSFLANMSHEIRTPMNAIIGFSSFLRDPMYSEAEKNEFVKIITQNSELLLLLIDDILDLSKIQANQMVLNYSRVNLSDLLKDLHRTFSIEAAKKQLLLKLTCEKITDDFTLNADPTRLKQTLNNLLSNAIKFTQQGSIEFGIKNVDSKVTFFVSDTGIGIPHDAGNRIFERFSKIEGNANLLFRGTGLGLAICKNFVELWGGAIWYESELSKGTTFYFTYPVSEINIPKASTSVRPTIFSVPNLTGKVILIAEDDETNFMLLTAYLAKTKALIHWARNGAEVIDYIQNNPADIILMDVKMPVMDGIETTRRLREMNIQQPIIAQTAHAYDCDIQKFLATGFNDFLVKPIMKEKLIEVLRKFI